MSKIRRLSPALEEKAKVNLDEDQNKIEENLKYIKEWLLKQPHLKIPDNDQWLLAFFRGCKYRLERVKTKLDNYYSFRTFYPEMLQNRNVTISPLCDLINLGLFVPFKSNVDETRPIYLYWHYKFDPEKYSYNDLLKLYYISYDVLMLEYDEIAINGIIILCDFKDTTFSHITYVTPSWAKKLSQIALEGYPFSIKQVHYVNLPQGMKTVIDLFRRFGTEKIKDRFKIHTDITELRDHIPVEDLPKELGGKNGSIDELAINWKSKLHEYNEYIINDEQYRSNENLRVGKLNFDAEIFGTEGTFRKLAID